MFIERFISYLKFEKRFSPHTVSAYQKDLQQFSAFLESNELAFSTVRHQEIRGFVVDLIDKECEARSVNRKLSTLRSFYKFLLRERLVSGNPLLQIKSPKIAKRLPKTIETDKVDFLLNSEDIFASDFEGLRDRLIIELLFGTGMRLAELLALKDCDFDKWNQALKVFGKRSKERIVPLNITLLKVLEKYIIEKVVLFPVAEMLIVTQQGKPAYPKLIYRVVKKYLTHVSTQEKRSPHILRHTFATALLNNGADLNAIKELLGHASLAATQVYTHNSVERLKLIYKQAHPKA